ncbi:hypothetical protein ACOSQ3_032504 [Xanthoceras sorbifolium]
MGFLVSGEQVRPGETLLTCMARSARPRDSTWSRDSARPEEIVLGQKGKLSQKCSSRKECLARNVRPAEIVLG